jgi:methionine-rich copper-binding protein CopC
VFIGDIGPKQTGVGQFIFRGDTMGVHRIDMDFKGFITGGGLPVPVPVNGSVCTTVEVQGPPNLQVVVRHPASVMKDEIYDLIVEITNLSGLPALYTSLELFVGSGAHLVDQNGIPIAASNEVRTIGTIPPGRTARLAYRVESQVAGKVIACQAIASQNITLSVDTGPGGTCNINNMYPAQFQPLPDDMPPTVIGINPLNGQPNIPVTTSVVAVLTPRTSCLTADTWTNVVTAPINGDPAKGLEVVSADLSASGTFYLEELDAFGNPVGHVPTDLVIENPPAGGTTIAVLRLGLNAPLSQSFLKPNTRYRATLTGGEGGLCSAASGETMPETFSWIFSTAPDCTTPSHFALQNSTPADGQTNVAVNQAIELNFSNRINLSSLRFDPDNLTASTFGVYQGDANAGTLVPGTLTASNLNTRLIYTPSSHLPADTQFYVRLTNGLSDACGHALETSGNVQWIGFHTQPIDTTAPAAPQVQPVPALTNANPIAVSGTAEPLSIVRIYGGALPASASVPDSGLFNVTVPLTPNTTHHLQAQAVDGSGNASPLINVDINSHPLIVVQDATPPSMVSILPANGSSGVPRDTAIEVAFSEPIAPDTVTNATLLLLQGNEAVPGTVMMAGATVTFTPSAPLTYGATYMIQIPAAGIRDLAGNGLDNTYQSNFTVEIENLTPIADAGAYAPVPVGGIVTLNGGGSSDPNGDPISFQWELINRPAGSNAVLANATTATPFFLADQPGAYTVQLVVSDGKLSSSPAQAVITTSNTTPVANAGPAQTVAMGAIVQLDGSGSSDIDGNTLTYHWTLECSPGITPPLSDPDIVNPTFEIGLADRCTATLIVHDGTINSAPDPVTISTINSKPEANAGPDQVVSAGSTVTLSSSSTDPDGDALTYQWSFISVPAGSNAVLSNPTTPSPTFVPNVIGEYIVQLIVNDGELSSDPDPVTITAGTPPPPSLNYGDVVSGEISAAGETDLYNFVGTTGDRILLTLVDTSGGLYTSGNYSQIYLYSPTGAYIGHVNATSHTAFTLTETGIYSVSIRASDLRTTGGYSIGLERLTPPTPVDATMQYGDILPESLTQAAEVDQFTFTGTTGDKILLTLVDTSGGLYTSGNYSQIYLYSPTGAYVGYVNATSHASFTLTETGTYSLALWASDLRTTGGYRIELSLQ